MAVPDNVTPFIHLLRSRYEYYFYDVNKNEIINISKECYDFLKNIMCGKISWQSPFPVSICEEIQDLIKNGYLSVHRPGLIKMPWLDTLDYYLSHKLHFLMLQITQKCNFRCKYCHFSGEESGYHSHNFSSINWDTAKKAIDFFGARCRDAKDISVIFYGGEPLLEKSLLHKCIEYCNDMFEGKNLNYHLTTNAELLDVATAQYLIDNNVKITVSLDGPKDIHNRNRKHASDGSGTFDIVYENLVRIKQQIPDYYRKINFNSVLDPAIDCSPVDDFFSGEIFGNAIIQTNIMSPPDGKKLYLSDEFLEAEKRDKLLFLMVRSGMLKESQIPIIARNYFSDFYEFESKFKKKHKLPDITSHTGSCKPGYNKLFVSTSGKFYICEKARDDSAALCLGSLEEGFNIDKIKEICDFICRDKCKNCWNIRNCNVCPMMIDDGNKLSTELFNTACSNSRRKTEDNFMDLIALTEAASIIKRREEVRYAN